ncbi:MAG: disulfide bond formation regulator [Cryomorphaceae bacterium BACL21 MAG-121220-bin10]|jgi:putative redox protein|nr:MAG: disulfide bond formation regulator [Cryomorphaceae bacterium BACL21 MAG-121220-bin10]|tara:strand:- start:122524 stop:122976 length:453 start_codon:yes stop_codon:yes gene_type:complete
MKVTLNRLNDDYHFIGQGPNGIPVSIDNKGEATVKGASPMELLLMAIGGCNAIDIIYVLKKQRQIVTSYRVAVEGTRGDFRKAHPFKSAHVSIYLEGPIAHAKALRAASLSFEQYCSVSMTLAGAVTITYDVYVNGAHVTPDSIAAEQPQ